MQTPRTEFAQALRAIASERKLDADVILDTIKQAIIAAYKRDAKEQNGEELEGLEFEVVLNSTSGEAQVFAFPEGKPEEKKDVTPPGFGRIAAQTAKQVIHQKIREAEKDAVMGEFSGRVSSLISGMILRFDGPDVRVDLGRTEGIMPASERVQNERLNANQRLTFLFKDIQETPRGKLIILSRSDAEFVKKLFEREVPEISSGSVEIKAISREAGVRTKIAVSSNQSGVDPVGSCVGQKGVRVQAVTNELGGERVDIIPWSDDTSEFIKASLAPAENLSVSLKDKEKLAIVEAPEDQLSLAIGRDGQNARLSAKLTGWKIEIESSGEPVEKKEEVGKKKTMVKTNKTPKSATEKAEEKEDPSVAQSDDSTQTDDTNDATKGDSASQGDTKQDKKEDFTDVAKSENEESVDKSKNSPSVKDAGKPSTKDSSS
jgi:N utilization substance protein A